MVFIQERKHITQDMLEKAKENESMSINRDDIEQKLFINNKERKILQNTQVFR